MLDRTASNSLTSAPTLSLPSLAMVGDDSLSTNESRSTTIPPTKRPKLARTKQQSSAAERQLNGLKQPSGGGVAKKTGADSKPSKRKRVNQKALLARNVPPQQATLFQDLFERLAALEGQQLATEQKWAAAEKRLATAAGELLLLQGTVDALVDYGDQQLGYLDKWTEAANSALGPAITRDIHLRDEMTQIRRDQCDLVSRVQRCERQWPVRRSYEDRLERYAGGPAVAAQAPPITTPPRLETGANF